MKRKLSYTDGPDIPEIAVKAFPFEVCLRPDCTVSQAGGEGQILLA